MSRKLTPVTSFPTADKPFSENQMRWMIFNAANNGLSAYEVIKRVGRRVYIDEEAFDRWIDAQNPKSSAA